MAASIGAEYVARWTPLRIGWMIHSLANALSLKGLSIVELISPCLIYDALKGDILDPVDRMKFYNDQSEIRFTAPTPDLDLRGGNKIIEGEFVQSGLVPEKDLSAKKQI
jgi:pyruvate/2-oxoacid:ferredoxin oxidoreductase beta subunit